MKASRNDIITVVETLLTAEAKRAVKFVSPTLVVRATRTLFGRKIDKSQDTEITLTIGRPNYLERDYIKRLQKAKEPFPVRKVWLRFPPQRKAA